MKIFQPILTQIADLTAPTFGGLSPVTYTMSTSISVTQYQQSLKFRLLSNLVFECPKTFREEGEVVNCWRTNGEINDSRYMAHLLQGKLSIHDMIRIDMIHVLS